MPPRYAYWTILVDDQPTAFRSGSQEELMPTFKRLKAKQRQSAMMMWFQNGKLWPSRIDAQEAMRARGEMGRRGDDRQAGSGFRDRERKPTRERSAWTPRGEPSTPAPARTPTTSSIGNQRASSFPHRSEPIEPSGNPRTVRRSKAGVEAEGLVRS